MSCQLYLFFPLHPGVTLHSKRCSFEEEFLSSLPLDLTICQLAIDTHLDASFHCSHTDNHFTVTRSHKLNDRDHAGLADGTAGPEAHVPKYFAKHGYVDADPKKVKKNGHGKGNW